MSFRLLTISSMYPGYLNSFYLNNPSLKGLSYDDQYSKLLDDSTEFVSSYTKTFNLLEIESRCIIANNHNLQDRWKVENGFKPNGLRSTILEQVNRYQPEVLLIEDLRFVDGELLGKLRNDVRSIKLIVAYHCAPYNSSIIDKLKCIDFLFTCTPGLKKEFEEMGVKAYSVYHGFDRFLLDKVYTSNTFSQKDFVFTGSLFVGNGYHRERIELIDALQKAGIDISLYVNIEDRCKVRAKQTLHILNSFFKKINLSKLNEYIPLLEYGEKPISSYTTLLKKSKEEPVYGIDMYKLLAKSNIVLNNHGEIAGEYAGNMRMFEVTGVGSCLLTDSKRNIADLFEPDYEIVVYDSPDDCINKVRWLLDHDREREKIAYAGQQKTLKSHKVEDRCKVIKEILLKELG